MFKSTFRAYNKGITPLELRSLVVVDVDELIAREMILPSPTNGDPDFLLLPLRQEDIVKNFKN